MAERLGVSFPTVNRWENGKAKPSPVLREKLRSLEAAAATARIFEPEPPPYTGPALLDFTADANHVKALVEGERLSFGHLANPVFATEVARIDALPHQRIAVYDFMLQQPRLRFLLADDAGAGKTIMSGLYIREMLSRRLLKRILIVVPAGLVGNWQHELSTLFGLDFHVVAGSDARLENPFVGRRSDRVIVSVDTLAGDRMFAALRREDVEPYDLVIFDEAHKLSYDRTADYRDRKTQRYKLAEALAGVPHVLPQWKLTWATHHLLLLTATPHMGKDFSYYALWRLLEPEMISTPQALQEIPSDQKKRHFIRRSKEEMVKLSGEPLYPRRVADTLTYELARGENGEQALYDRMTDYLLHVYNRARLLNRSAARLAMNVFQRRLASSTWATYRSLERRIEKLDEIIEEIESGRITIDEILARQRNFDDSDDVFDGKTSDEESSSEGREENELAEDKLLGNIVAASLADLFAEREVVVKLRDLAYAVYAEGSESKFDRLSEIITDPRYANEKLIVFTEHRDTLDFLVRRLHGLGYTGQTATIHGGMHFMERQQQVEHFRAPAAGGGARFMICTDAAAEGINLQFCWIMINYDVPWNPARLEQRMGRIHRYGQMHDPVIILNLVAPSTREGRVLHVLLEKLAKIRKQLRADKVYDSIGRIFAGVSIKQYMERALHGEIDFVEREMDGLLTKDHVRAISEQEKAIYGEGGDVKRELPRLQERIGHETYFRLLPGYVRRYLETAAPLVDIQIDGDPGDSFAFRPQEQGAADRILAAMEMYPLQQRARLTVARPADPRSSIWIHPGEAVFDAFREIARKRLGKDALRGAVFIDPTASVPYIFHLARITIVRKADPDIEDLRNEETIECRLIGLRQTESADLTLCPAEHLLLLHGRAGLPAEAQKLAAMAESHRALAHLYVTERVAREMAADRRSGLTATLAERQSFLRRGLDFREAELAAARAKIAPKARDGNKTAAQRLTEIREEQRLLELRRETALAILRREPELIAPGEVEFIAHALVVPTADEEEIRRHGLNVEQTAMDLVRAYEEAAGANVRLVHLPRLAREAGLPDHPGFDILSERAGERRCIEVKGSSAGGDIEITDNEWARACNLRSEYWLYAVYHCASPFPQMVRVQDPFEKLLVRPFTKTQVIESVRQVGGVRVAHRQVMEAGEM
jgi:SNF2 family DNA or RNA helicase